MLQLLEKEKTLILYAYPIKKKGLQHAKEYFYETRETFLVTTNWDRAVGTLMDNTEGDLLETLNLLVRGGGEREMIHFI